MKTWAQLTPVQAVLATKPGRMLSRKAEGRTDDTRGAVVSRNVGQTLVSVASGN